MAALTGAIGPEELRDAWSKVLASDAADDQLSRGVASFERDLENQLGSLAAELAWDSYRPDPLFEVRIPKSDGFRVLHIPPVRDRVVERAVLDALTPVVDPVLGPWSFAYRPGLGVNNAISALVDLRESGATHVARADIDDCFPNLPRALALRLAATLAPDEGLVQLVDQLVGRGFRRKGSSRVYGVGGLAQGCALSPLLANLVLAQVDEDLVDAGFQPVRYSDDLAIAAHGPEEAREALRVLAQSLEELGMKLGSEADVMSFDQGFTFLGEDFGPRYPPRQTAGIAEPERRSLYLGLQGSRVRTQAGRLVVESADDTDLIDVPSSRVSRIVCFGSVGVSAGVRSFALEDGVDVVFASRRGSYQGHLAGGHNQARADRLVRQVSAYAGDELLPVCRAIVHAKVSKQIVVLRRFGRREHVEGVRDAVHQLKQLLLMLPDAGNREEIMGLEGAAARAYFGCFGHLFPAELAFETRSRQPPLDVANSALSFLYTVTLGECVTACYAAGLEPMLGVLHAPHERRPSLALDLLEELRPYVVDQVVLAAARARVLTADHGRKEKDRSGVYLNRAGRAALLTEYETRMLTKAKGVVTDFSGSIRRHVYVQAQRLAAAIEDPTVSWHGMSWR